MPMCADAAMRLDRLLTTLAVGSRSQVKTMLRAGRVTVNGQVVRSADAHVQPGDRLTLDQQPLDARTTRHVLLNKPCGVLTAARDPKQPTVLDLLPPAYRACGCMPVGRLDKDTSGLLVAAKNNEAHLKLSEQLKARKAVRKYIALVNGNIKEDSGTINKPIGRSSADRKKMAVTANGREAVTHYNVLERFGRYTLTECVLETGRTHQIRVHMASIGHSLVGDKTYGIKKEKFNLPGQLLHARTIGFVHPSTGEMMRFSSELPDYFSDVIEKLRAEKERNFK